MTLFKKLKATADTANYNIKQNDLASLKRKIANAKEELKALNDEFYVYKIAIIKFVKFLASGYSNIWSGNLRNL